MRWYSKIASEEGAEGPAPADMSAMRPSARPAPSPRPMRLRKKKKSKPGNLWRNKP